MNKTISFILVWGTIFHLYSCSSPQIELPIEEVKLKEILMDVHVAEAALQPLVGQKKDSLKELYFSQIFEIHEVHPVDFEATMEILQNNPKRMKKIYKELTEDVQEKKMEFRKKKEMDDEKPKPKTRTKPRRDTPSRSLNDI